MTYAQGRVFLDADSHIMELPDFLRDNADPEFRDRMPRLAIEGGDVIRDALATVTDEQGHPADRVEELLALGDGIISGPKGYEALGAFNTSERTKALDLLGFSNQWVFATFSAGVVFNMQDDPELMAAAATAHNRGMATFCSPDDRLWGVGATSLDDPEQAVVELENIIELGLKAVWVPHRPAGGRSPGHDDLDPFWARAAEAGIPVVLHVGGNPLQMKPAWMNTGRDVPTDWLGGGENVRGKDMISLHQAAETFVGTMVLDGVLDRHRDLRVGVVELGAAWVPAMLRRLDQIAEIWKRSEPELAALTRKPSQQISAQMGFTPYPFEDVGAMIRDSNPDLYLFSSDYPHIEGGRNPLGRFSASLESFGDDVLQKFYSDNMDRLVSITS
ncbi:MAG: putative TIM-barrel fold metal-dependent hydrolase [Acidimicrobiales bacterium]|jgi:uncharacterized protein